MYRAILFIAALLAAQNVFSQGGETANLIIKNKETKAVIVEATAAVRGTEISARSDATGRLRLTGVSVGEQVIEISSPGYETVELKLTFPLTDQTEREVLLEIDNELGEVTVTSTRTGREINASPTRVEAIDEEEIDEKISMRPANVSMVLAESTGIQVQQTSAVSNTQTVRIQGLDGRYTQLLKDGFPAFGGFSTSLSVLEIPPLDLRQVEIIKGPSATLFGGGAIAGVVNFVTKDPSDDPATTLIFNQTSKLGSDFSVFNTNKFKRVGYTLLGAANYQREFDVDKDDFTELPNVKSFAFSPKVLFYAGEKTTVSVGNSTSYQKRVGGDVVVLRGSGDGFHRYFERNDSFRNISTFNLEHTFEGGGRLFAKQSVAVFDRELTIPNYSFTGRQLNSYTDVSYGRAYGKHAFVFGGSAVYDRFREDVLNAFSRDETRTTVGGFVQDTVDVTNKLSLEAGFRLDYARDYGAFPLPRVSVLYRITDNLTSRISFGLGYKLPTVFTEEAETLLFRNVVGIGNTLEAERSIGGTFDFNYRNTVGENFTYSINQMFFHTQINQPLILRPAASGVFRFRNADSPEISRGFETNVRLAYGVAKLFLGYTFTDARAGYLPGDRRITLLSRHKIDSALVFEKHESYKTGVEFYYGGPQTLDDRTLTRSLAEVGIFGEKTFGRYSLFVNAENLTDVRQSRYGQVVLPPHQSPAFAEVYTHLEGRTFNGGIKIRF